MNGTICERAIAHSKQSHGHHFKWWTWLPQHRPFQPSPRMPSNIRILRIAKRVFFSWAVESIDGEPPGGWFLGARLSSLQGPMVCKMIGWVPFYFILGVNGASGRLLGWLNNKAVTRPRHSKLRARCQNPVLPELQRRKGDILWPPCLLQRKHDSPLGLTCPNPWDVPKFSQPRSIASKHVSRVQALLKSQKHLPRPSKYPLKRHVLP